MKLTRRQLLTGTAAALGTAGASGCAPTTLARSGQAPTLIVWHSWGGVMGPRFKQVLTEFERTHPGQRIKAVYTRNNLSTNQKFFTSVAAGSPPDVTFVDGPQVASWAEWGALEPLGARIRSAGIRADDYFPPTWRQNEYRDEVWALTYSADPNFTFAWNRTAFRNAGLNPDQPPASIDELTEVATRLTRVDGGNIRQIGIIPWAQYGPANSMFTWGWAFGGEFYAPAIQKITADHPRVVRALEWMIGFAKKYDPARIQSMQQGFDNSEQNPFYSGRLCMQCLHIGGIRDIQRYAPNLDFGLTYIPAPPDGEAHSSWVGGWCMSIPKGARNPEGAWEFIRWLGHSEEGTTFMGRTMGVFPGMRRSPYFAEARRERHKDAYVKILEEARHQRPVMPVQAFYMRELQRAVEAAVFSRMTPAEALARARENTQSELDLTLAGSGAA